MRKKVCANCKWMNWKRMRCDYGYAPPTYLGREIKEPDEYTCPAWEDKRRGRSVIT